MYREIHTKKLVLVLLLLLLLLIFFFFLEEKKKRLNAENSCRRQDVKKWNFELLGPVMCCFQNFVSSTE